MNQHERKQRRQMQVIASACREVAAEVRAVAQFQSGTARTDLEFVAASQEESAERLEREAGGALPAYRPPSESERQEARQDVYAAMNAALKSSGAPKELLRNWGAN